MYLACLCMQPILRMILELLSLFRISITFTSYLISWLNSEQIATIKYVMQHPDVRPEVWSKPGHDDAGSVIANVTPLEKTSWNAELANYPFC